MILQKIVQRKKVQLQEEMSQVTENILKEKINSLNISDTINFYSALKDTKGVSIISEVKKASPSKGIIKENFDPVEIAKSYSKENVQAISVLTEKYFFQGNDEYLQNIRKEVKVPLLRKDFIIDSRQIYQARILGADAILLIVSILSDEELKDFRTLANSIGLYCLVEVHDKTELERAINIGADIIGINNRNLNTFNVDIKTTEDLMKFIPGDKVVVSESGIENVDHMKYLNELGVDAVLIGETLMRAASIKEKLIELRSY